MSQPIHRFDFAEIRVHSRRPESRAAFGARLEADLGKPVRVVDDAGKKPGRERDDETILFWHRGLGTTDIALGHAMLEKAARLGVGQRLRFA